MKSVKSLDFNLVTSFIDMAYGLAVDFGAFERTSFSSKSFVDRILENDDDYISKVKSSKFEKIKYSYAYRRKSSSGKEANTSIIFYSNGIYHENSGTYKSEFFLVCWPIHVMRKHNFCFDLENNKIFKYIENFPSFTLEEMTFEDVKTYLEKEYRNASFSTFKKVIPEVVGHNNNSLSMNPNDFRNNMCLCNMVLIN